MKKTLIILPLTLLLFGCKPDPSPALPPVEPETLQAVLNPTTSTLTSEDSKTAIPVNLSVSGKSETYGVEIGAPCYLHSKHPEIVMKAGGYFKSISTYHVDRLIVDFYGAQLGYFDVFATNDGSGNPVQYHNSSVAPIDPNGGGVVYEYPIDSNGWMIKNTTENNKPGFYSVTIIFSL